MTFLLVGLPVAVLILQALLQRTLDEAPDTGIEKQETFGLFHEALRPLAHRYVLVRLVPWRMRVSVLFSL